MGTEDFGKYTVFLVRSESFEPVVGRDRIPYYDFLELEDDDTKEIHPIFVKLND